MCSRLMGPTGGRPKAASGPRDLPLAPPESGTCFVARSAEDIPALRCMEPTAPAPSFSGPIKARQFRATFADVEWMTPCAAVGIGRGKKRDFYTPPAKTMYSTRPSQHPRPAEYLLNRLPPSSSACRLLKRDVSSAVHRTNLGTTGLRQARPGRATPSGTRA